MALELVVRERTGFNCAYLSGKNLKSDFLSLLKTEEQKSAFEKYFYAQPLSVFRRGKLQ
jgi:hypothetical protein